MRAMRLTHVTTAELDRLEFHAVRSGEHGRVAAQLMDLANRVDAGSEISRAELFVRAGEQWEIAQEFERACSAYQRAIDDGGPTVIDARALSAGALLQLNEVGTAYAHLERLESERPRGSRPTSTSPRRCTRTTTWRAPSGGPRSARTASSAWTPRPTSTTCCWSCCGSGSASASTWAWTRTPWTGGSTPGEGRAGLARPRGPRRPR